MKTSTITFIAVIVWFAILITASVMCGSEQDNQPVIEDPTIIQVPGDLEAIPYTDTTGNTWIIYK